MKEFNQTLVSTKIKVIICDIGLLNDQICLHLIKMNGGNGRLKILFEQQFKLYSELRSLISILTSEEVLMEKFDRLLFEQSLAVRVWMEF